MEIETGNLGALDTEGTGWFIGYSSWTRTDAPASPNLRYIPEDALLHKLHTKWMVHPAGDDRGSAKPPSEGRTISILVSDKGDFHLEFSEEAGFPEGQTVRYTLREHGDFVIWGSNLYHRWFVAVESVIMTIRWIP